MSGHILVDLDGTLAHYGSWSGANHIGAPIKPMVERVKRWLAEGKDVRIFTARAANPKVQLLDGTEVDMIAPVQAWCLQHLGQVLPVTCSKDFSTLEIYDDRAIGVEHNTGRIITDTP